MSCMRLWQGRAQRQRAVMGFQCGVVHFGVLLGVLDQVDRVRRLAFMGQLILARPVIPFELFVRRHARR
mgnify:CR=1 FL=1